MTYVRHILPDDEYVPANYFASRRYNITANSTMITLGISNTASALVIGKHRLVTAI